MGVPVLRRLAAALALVATLAGCARAGGTGGAQAHVLRIGDVQSFDTLNPMFGTALSMGNLSDMTMAHLVRYGPDNRPIPELATVVPTQRNGGISADGMTITWHLRRGVRWSDGAPFDGDDVVFTTNAVNNPKNNVVGRDGWNLIRKIDEPDKFTVVFHLDKPFSNYLPTFFASAGAVPAILPKHLLASYPDLNHVPYNQKPVGIGPFRYVEWVRDDHVTLEPNPYYWRGQPKLKKVVHKFIPDRNTLFTQLQTGEIDLIPFLGSPYFDRLKDLPNVAYVRQPSYLYSHVDFNTRRPLLRDPVVRTALATAIDRRVLVDKVNHGIGIVQDNVETPASPWYRPVPQRRFDLAAANRMLDADGWKRGPDGVRVKNGQRLALNWGAASGANDVDAMIEQITATWRQIGVAVDVHHYAVALFFALAGQGGIVYGGKFDVAEFAWQLTPSGDLNTINSCALIPPNGQNVTRLCDPVLERDLQAMKRTYDEAAKAAIITRAVRRIDALVPYQVLFLREDIHAFRRGLTGWHPNNTTPFDDMLNVDITGA